MSEFDVFRRKRFLAYLIIFLFSTSFLFVESYTIYDYYRTENNLELRLDSIYVTLYFNGTTFNMSRLEFKFNITNPSEIQSLLIWKIEYYIFLNGEKLQSIQRGKDVSVIVSPVSTRNIVLGFNITFHKDLDLLDMSYIYNSWIWYIYLLLRMKLWSKYMFLDFQFMNTNGTIVNVVNMTQGDY